MITTDNNRGDSKRAVRLFARAKEADVFLVSGELAGALDEEFMTQNAALDSDAKKAYLFLATYGGDPDVAYRIARCLERRYEYVVACIDGPCSSAGTMLILGANEVVMTDFARLGPLDIQLRKRDELFETSSGLTAGLGLDALRSEAFATFNKYFLELKMTTMGSVTLTTAMEVAAKLTIGLFQPVYAQLDPMKIGEDERAMRITQQYGERLLQWSKNAKRDARTTLSKLIGHYPSHSYVIDREEAETLLARVRKPDSEEQSFLATLSKVLRDESSEPVIRTFGCPKEPDKLEGDHVPEDERESPAGDDATADHSYPSGETIGAGTKSTNGQLDGQTPVNLSA